MSLQISNLTKVYKNGVKAMDNINLEIGNGIFGLLGPNGAGKSTLMRTLATLQKPDSGNINFNALNVLKEKMELRKMLGYLPQEFGVYKKESADNLLNYFALLKGITSKKDRLQTIDEVLSLVNLSDARYKNVSDYSGGMKQRFGIAQLLLNQPKLIIVDEPVAGLDPAERNRFLNIIREIGNNSTVIFSTHIVEDIKELSNAMAIMNKGKILLKTQAKMAIKEMDGKVWTKTIPREYLEEMENKYEILSSNYNHDNSINIRAYSIGEPNSDFKLAKPILEDVYFHTLRMC